MLKKILLLFLPFLVSCSFSIGQDIPVPNGFQLVDWDQEDIDLDGLIDVVAVYNPKSPDKSGELKKELILYRWNGEKWIKWIRTKGPFLPNQGELDPYRGIEINGQTLSIRHAGKDEMIWQTVDEYQLIDGDFRLVSYTHNSFVLCQTLQIISLNTLTGAGMIAIISGTCDEADNAKKTIETEEFTMDPFEANLSNRYKNPPITFLTPKLNVRVNLSPF